MYKTVSKSFEELSLNELYDILEETFEGDFVKLKLFKDKKEAIAIDGVSSKDGLINIIFNKDGIGNFDIIRPKTKSVCDGNQIGQKFVERPMDEHANHGLLFICNVEICSKQWSKRNQYSV